MASGVLKVNGEVWNTACMTWTVVDLGIVGAVQIAEPFTVWQGAHVLEGRAGDYLVRTTNGTLVPIPQWLWSLLDGETVKGDK